MLSGVLLLIVTAVFAITKKTDPHKKHTADNNSAIGVIYGHNINWKGADEKLDLDIYWPPNATKGKKYPVLLMIHGGTFIGGNKNGFGPSLKQLADSGFVGVSINYRLGWKVPKISDGCNADLSDNPFAIYRALQDTHAALRYLVHNAEKYYIDKNWIFVGGGSAGAITALSVTYITQPYADKIMPQVTKKLGGLYNSSNDLTDKYKIRGICDMWGALPDSTLITASNAVPTIMFHGTADKVVPYDHGTWRNNICPNYPMLYGSACLYRQLRKYNTPVILTSVIGGKHGPTELNHEGIMSNTACFLHSVIKGTAHSGSYTTIKTGCL